MPSRHDQESSDNSAHLELPKSKTQRKKEMLDLQRLGVNLCRLSVQQLSQIPLPEVLLNAIMEAKRLKANGAKRRQAQYIGKLMRQIDSEPILQAYQKLQSTK